MERRRTGRLRLNENDSGEQHMEGTARGGYHKLGARTDTGAQTWAVLGRGLRSGRARHGDPRGRRQGVRRALNSEGIHPLRRGPFDNGMAITEQHFDRRGRDRQEQHERDEPSTRCHYSSPLSPVTRSLGTAPPGGERRDRRSGAHPVLGGAYQRLIIQGSPCASMCARLPLLSVLGDSGFNAPVPLLPDREHQVLQEEGGQLGSATGGGFAIDGGCMLTYGLVAPIGPAGDGLVGMPFQQKERNLSLRRCQLPAIELVVDGPGSRSRPSSPSCWSSRAIWSG